MVRIGFGRSAVAAALCLCFGLAGCGRKGALEAPPGSRLPRASTAGPSDSRVSAPESSPSRARTGAVVRPNRPFVLDKLL